MLSCWWMLPWLRWLLGLMFCYDRGLAALEQQLPRRVRGVRNQPSVVVMFWGKEATKSDDHCIFMHFFSNSPLQGVFFVFISLGNKECTWHLWQYWEMTISTTKNHVFCLAEKPTPWLKSFRRPNGRLVALRRFGSPRSDRQLQL